MPPALLTSLGTENEILFLLLGVEIAMRKLLLVLKASLEVVQQQQLTAKVPVVDVLQYCPNCPLP